MTAATMLMRFIWKLETPVKNAARRESPFCWSTLPGGREGNVWKWSGRPTSFTAAQSGSQTGCHMGSMSHEQRSEEHTSELQSQSNLVCRLLLEKKKQIQHNCASHASV